MIRIHFPVTFGLVAAQYGVRVGSIDITKHQYSPKSPAARVPAQLSGISVNGMRRHPVIRVAERPREWTALDDRRQTSHHRYSSQSGHEQWLRSAASEAQPADITAVICHYNPTRHVYLQHLVALCVAALRRIADDLLTILVCDGSPEPDHQLAATLSGNNACYLHAGRQLSFGGTYNLGVEAAQTEYVVLLANDILISSPQVRQLAAEVRDDVACAIPYLTRSDYATQAARRTRVPRRCYPASMTINVNAFRRDVLQGVGSVPEELSGCFNDAVMFQRLRNQGHRIALVNVGQVDHLRAITRFISSNLDYERDLATAPSLAPDLFRGIRPGQKNTWARLYANAAQRPLSRLLWLLVGRVPWQLDQHYRLGYVAAWLEPYLACKLDDYRRALLRLRRRLA